MGSFIQPQFFFFFCFTCKRREKKRFKKEKVQKIEANYAPFFFCTLKKLELNTKTKKALVKQKKK